MRRTATSDLSYYGIAGIFYLTVLLHFLLTADQAYTVDHTDRGEAPDQTIRLAGKATARILPSCLLHGIDHICHCLRYHSTSNRSDNTDVFQQNLYEEVTNAANSFPTTSRARYQAAAASFRMPYWDWAANPPAGETFFPRAASTPTINIVTPQSDGQRVSFRNPLYAFRFNPLNPNGNDFSNLRGTPVSYPCSGMSKS